MPKHVSSARLPSKPGRPWRQAFVVGFQDAKASSHISANDDVLQNALEIAQLLLEGSIADARSALDIHVSSAGQLLRQYEARVTSHTSRWQEHNALDTDFVSDVKMAMLPVLMSLRSVRGEADPAYTKLSLEATARLVIRSLQVYVAADPSLGLDVTLKATIDLAGAIGMGNMAAARLL